MTATISTRLNKLKSTFTEARNWEDRYDIILQKGKDLDPMPKEFLIDQNVVKGCQSQVWMFAKDEDGRLKIWADSDALIVKGIIAILLELFSDAEFDDILSTDQQFIEELELSQHLSMNRANGLQAMMKQIRIYAMAYKQKQLMTGA